MIKIFVFSFVLIVLSGCMITKSPVAQYQLSVEPLSEIDTSSGCKDKSLKVSQAFSSSSLMSLDMNYIEDKNKIYSYSQSQWNDSVNQEVTSHILKVLRTSKLFKNTQNSKSRSRSDLILEINIIEFMQYFTDESKKSYVNIEISITLIDEKTAQVVATSSFSSKKKVDTLDASGGVIAFDEALRDILTQGVNFLNRICR
ncbi:MAG: membrane integrity-associated transporter subunit PqiC [Sulfurimonas sp.]|nr:membrane integrity-associated transporter subunit PqiC [Sulfurimonas sp.]